MTILFLQDLNIPHLRKNIHKEIMDYYEPRTPTLSFDADLKPVPKCEVVSVKSDSADVKEEASTSLQSQVKPEDSAASDSSQPSTSNMTQIQTQTFHTNLADEQVFKVPQLTKCKDPCVTVKTENLKGEVSDVEMLSARSTDGRQPMSATISELTQEPDKDNTDNTEAVKDDKNKTISQDTKNLIKKAIQNASFKKRTGYLLAICPIRIFRKFVVTNVHVC